MRITVFGATGGVGGHIVRQGLESGHSVTAVVRDRGRLAVPDQAGLRVVTVPGLAEADRLEPAVLGADAVLSGVGPAGRRDSGVATTATRGILGAMAATGVRRIVVVSAAPVGPVPDGEGVIGRYVAFPLIRRLLAGVYADLAAMETELRHSDTDWTVVRPPRLTDRPVTGRYRTVVGGNVPKGGSIPRANVAHAMLAALTDPATVDQAIGVAA